MDTQTDSTQDNGPAGSLNDELLAAYDSYEETEEQSSERDIPEPDTVGDTDSIADDSTDSDNLSKDAGEEQETLEAEKEVISEKEEGGITAPEHWSATDKAVFDNSPPELQEWILARHKSMEADYTRKTQGIADFKRDYEPVQALLDPYKSTLAQMGVTPAQYVERLAQADRKLSQDPVNGLKEIAQMYNIPLSQLGENSSGEGDEFADPEMQTLRQELADLKGSVTQRQQAEYTERQNTIVSEIQQFAEAKDDAGELAHPYFNDVMDDIMMLAQAERTAGRQPVLQDLYDKAIWSNTSVREQMQAAITAAQAKKAIDEASAKAAQAKKASKSVSGAPHGSAPSADLSLREQLSSQF